MGLSCGIVGLPNVGKSTLFNALTRSAQALAANYPFATIDPNVGEVPVPDERLGVLEEICAAKRVVNATMRFVDIAGLVRGAASGQGLGNAFLAHIRETDAVAMVVRCFDDENVIHVEGNADPDRDIEIIGLEMALADLATLAKRIEKLEREARSNPKLADRLAAAKRLSATLEEGKPARIFPPGSLEAEICAELFLLTAKPLLYIANVDEEQVAKPGPYAQIVIERAKREASRAIVLCAKTESELVDLSAEEAREYMDALGIKFPALDTLVTTAYDLLGLMTFLTAGEQEVRAWTIERNTKAPQAAGKIHSDIERGFIRAEVINYDDYKRLRTMDALRSAGLLRSEGKDYVMQEGDVVNFRFNV